MSKGNRMEGAKRKATRAFSVPCRHATSGCTAMLLHAEKAEHEENCEFWLYTCPCPRATCNWSGYLEQVKQHLLTGHGFVRIVQGDRTVLSATDIDLPGVVDWVMLQSCFGHVFLLVVEKQGSGDDRKFYGVVQLIGSKQQAEGFTYTMDVGPPENPQHLTWEAPLRSIRDGIAAAIAASDCLSFDSTIAKRFAENGKLNLSVTISRNDF